MELPVPSEVRLARAEDLQISGDGSVVAFWAPPSDTSFFWNLRTQEVAPIPLPSGVRDEDVWAMLISGDGSQFLVNTGTAIWRTAANGRTSAPIVTLPNRALYHWAADGTVYYGDNDAGYRVVEGGDPQRSLDKDWREASWIRPIRNGEAILYTDMSPGEAGRIILLDLSTDEDTVLVEPGFDAHYLESGHLIYGGRDGQVRAALFDPESSEIGEPVVVLDSVKIEPLFGSMVLTADSYGTVVYVKEAPREKSSLNRRLAIMDRSGGPELVRTEEGDIGNASISRDGGHIAFSRDGNAWVVEVLTGRTHELGIQGQLSYVWSPNSEELAVGDNTGEGTTITFWRPDGGAALAGLELPFVSRHTVGDSPVN